MLIQSGRSECVCFASSKGMLTGLSTCGGFSTASFVSEVILVQHRFVRRAQATSIVNADWCFTISLSTKKMPIHDEQDGVLPCLRSPKKSGVLKRIRAIPIT